MNLMNFLLYDIDNKDNINCTMFINLIEYSKTSAKEYVNKKT